MNLIKQWRKDNDVDSQDLAYFLKVSPGCLSQIEKGIANISGDVAIKVSQLIGIPVFKLRPDLKMTDEYINQFNTYRATRNATRQALLIRKERKQQKKQQG